jgi:hypothetical protein
LTSGVEIIANKNSIVHERINDKSKNEAVTSKEAIKLNTSTDTKAEKKKELLKRAMQGVSGSQSKLSSSHISEGKENSSS